MIGLYVCPEVLGLLHAAKERPEDDGPRLVLCDWLEEHGDYARAEFLRLQLLLAPGSSLDPERRASTRQRVQELLANYGGGWLGPLWQHAGVWHRGLLMVELDRLRVPVGLEEMRPWIDSAHFEIPGREALRWALTLTPGLNHVTLALRRPWNSPRKVDRGLTVIPSVHTPPGTRTPATSAGAWCCRRSRCIQRSPLGLLPA
jgi:uncharacterized protein (TIGR02996 family)